MIDASTADAPRRQRIVDHINVDHGQCNAVWLEHYCRLPRSATIGAEMEDIGYSYMTISSQGQRYSIPLDPPMKAWSDARVKTETMYHEALKALGRSYIFVTQYRRPRGWTAALFTICALTFAFFSMRSNFLPGSLLYGCFLTSVPGFAKICYGIQPFVIAGMDLVHGAEVFYMARSRLYRYNVLPFSRVWWFWIVDTFIEGFGAFARFDGIVQELEAERAEAIRKSL